MNSNWQRYAPFGLYLSLVAALAAAGLYIVQRQFNLPLQISLALVIIGLAIFAILDPNRVRVALTGRQARYGSNALILSVAFIGILVVINLLAFQNSKRWDLTEDKQFTLAPETVSLLGELKQPVQAQAFFSSDLNPERAKGLLEQYKFNSQGRFDYEFIDPVANPAAAQQAKIARDGTIVLRMGDQMQAADTVSEQAMDTALVRLINPEEQVIYFLTGHGEFSPEGTGERSYAVAVRVLESKNYTVKTLNLLTDKQVPDDARLIVVAGPTKPVSAEEVAALKGFVDGGGSLIVMEDPTILTDFGEEADPIADYLSETWGIVLGNNLVVDVTSQQASVMAIGAQYASHQITQPLQGLVSILPGARSASASEAKDGITQVNLVSTSPQSWAESDLAAFQAENPEVRPDEGVDLLGPVPVAALGENLSTKARIVVFGDADLASDDYFTAYANGDLFTNSVDWAIGQEELISLTPKTNTQRFIAPPSTTTLNLVLLGSVFLLPGLALASGILVWIQRRKRG